MAVTMKMDVSLLDEVIGGVLAILFLIGMIWGITMLFAWWLVVLFALGGAITGYEKFILKHSLKK